jgi:hypothetical protein
MSSPKHPHDLRPLETAVTDVRQLLRYGADVSSEEILKVLEKTAYNHSGTGQPQRSHADG